MEIRLDRSSAFNLDATLCCGQAFRWDKIGKWWYGVVGENAFKISQTGERVQFENVDASFVRNYFSLDLDLKTILQQISKDNHIKQAIKMFRGLRILRQNPWESLISYICATYKSIEAIKHTLFNLSCRLGDKMRFDGREFYTFPRPKKLANASVGELTKCGLGYRTKYVHETARMVHENDFRFQHLEKASCEEAKSALLRFVGVGPKVADCVLLFSIGKLEAFPIDVWMKRVIMRHYSGFFQNEFAAGISDRKSLTNTEYEKLSMFGRTYFGKYAGYAQEYLYHHERIRHGIKVHH